MRHPARRKALLVGAACGVALLGAGVAFRKDLAFHYHVWRLDRAMTVEAAEPWLQKLEGHVQDPVRAQRLVGMLGPRRPWLTFWVFHWMQNLFPSDPLFGGLRHFARSLEDRLRCDKVFLALWAHFLHWRTGDAAMVLEIGQLPVMRLIFGLNFLLDPQVTRSELVQEVLLSMSESRFLGLAWFLGMSPIPPRLDLRLPLAEDDMAPLERHWEILEEWVRARRGRLSFDYKIGRFVEGPGPTDIPLFREPLPGWTGPVPQYPGRR